MIENQNNSLGHIYKMDVLRGIAIIAVFILHCYMHYLGDHLEVKIEKGDFFTHLIGKDFWAIFLTITPFGYGWTGVQLFLIISGYLIHLSYLKSTQKSSESTENYDFNKFYLRRFFRIYPPYLIVLLFLAFQYNRDILKSGEKIWDLISHLIMTYNLQDSTFFSFNGAFWSLALEVQLYLIYPLFLILRRKLGIQKTVFVLLFLYLFFTLIFNYFYIPNFYFALQNLVFKSWIIWGLGAFLAERHFEKKQLFKVSGWAIFGLLILASLVKTTLITLKINDLLWALFYVAFINYYLNISRNIPKLWEKFIASIGESSYSLYLIHQPVIMGLASVITFMGISKTRPIAHILDGLIIFLIAFAFSKGLYYLLEKPSIDFGKKIIEKIKKSN
jgi:peptidoglycan/LPS O-acetylase OafA/YrhL